MTEPEFTRSEIDARVLDAHRVAQRVLDVARAQGCDCQPEVYFHAPPRAGEVTGAEVQHDPWCALIVSRENDPPYAPQGDPEFKPDV